VDRSTAACCGGKLEQRPMRDQTYTVRPLEIGLLALLGLLWGMPYALTKVALTTIPPVTLVAARVALAAIVLWIVVFLRQSRVPHRWDLAARLFIQGCVACAIPYTLIAFGQQSVDSALAAILNSTAPLFVCLISLLWGRHEELTVGRLFGVTIGLGGVVLIAGASALAGLGRGMVGQVAIILATLSSAISAIYGRRFATVAPEIAAAGTLTAAAVVLVPLCFFVEAPLNSAPSAASFAALLVNAVAATSLGFVVYFRLIRTIGSMGTASVGYLKPAVGVLIGCLLMGESLTWTTGVGLIAILIGVAAINRTESPETFSRVGRLQPIQNEESNGRFVPREPPNRTIGF
jgi:drug/metabolite transporter (DMT)-like permease